MPIINIPDNRITVGSTDIQNGSVNKLLLHGAGDVVNEDASLTYDNTLRVKPKTPSVAGSIITSNGYLNAAHDCKVQGRYAYVTNNAANPTYPGFVVLDVSDPTAPSGIATLNHADLKYPYNLEIAGNYAYVSAYTVGGYEGRLITIDISNPNNPSIASYASHSGEYRFAHGVQVDNGYAYMACPGSSKLVSFNVSDPTNISEVQVLGHASLSGVRDCYLVGKYLYTACDAGDACTVIDVSDPTNMSVVGTAYDATELNDVRDVWSDGKHAYLCGYTDGRLTVVNVEDPTNPVVKGSVTHADIEGAHDVWVIGDYAVVAGSLADGIGIINISDPTNPTVEYSITDGTNNYFPHQGCVFGNYYIVATTLGDGVCIWDLFGAKTHAADIGSLKTNSLYVDRIHHFNDATGNLIKTQKTYTNQLYVNDSYIINSHTLKTPFYDVTAYGAYGDGSTDDSVAIQNALTAGSGAIVYFPPGEYKVTDELTVHSDTHLLGQYSKSIVYREDSQKHIFVLDAVDRVRFDGMTMHQNTIISGNAQHGCIVTKNACSNISVANCYIYDSYSAIWPWQCTNLRIIDCEMNSCSHPIYLGYHPSGTYPDWHADDPAAGSVSGVSVLGCHVHDSLYSGDGVKVNKHVRNVVIDGCLLHNNPQDGIDLFVSGDRVVISNNVIYGNSVVGIDIKSDSGVYPEAAWGKNRECIISGNIFHNNGTVAVGGSAVKLWNPQSSSNEYPYNFIISDNLIRDHYRYGIISRVNNVVISDNIFYNNCNVTAGDDSNTFACLYLYGKSGEPTKNYSIVGNVFVNNGADTKTNAAIDSLYAKNVSVIGNLVDNDPNLDNPYQNYGIRLGTECSGWLVVGNNVSDSVTTKFGVVASAQYTAYGNAGVDDTTERSLTVKGIGKFHNNKIRIDYDDPSYGIGINAANATWARLYGFLDDAGSTSLGGFGAVGPSGSIDYYYIGQDNLTVNIAAWRDSQMVNIGHRDTPQAQLHVKPAASGYVGLMVEGATAQSGNLAEFVGESNSQTNINKDGVIEIHNGTNIYPRKFLGVAQFNEFNPVTGAIKIKKTKGSNANTMAVYRITGFDYLTASNQNHWEVIIAGYWYSPTPTWLRYSAEIRGPAPFDRVRLMREGTDLVILIGETTTNWSSPSINMDIETAGYTGITHWAKDWQISRITSETGLTSIAEPSIPYRWHATNQTLGIGCEQLSEIDTNAKLHVRRDDGSCRVYVEAPRLAGTVASMELWNSDSNDASQITKLNYNHGTWPDATYIGNVVNGVTKNYFVLASGGSASVVANDGFGIGVTTPKAQLHSTIDTIVGVASGDVADGDIGTEECAFKLDESGNQLKFRVRYSDGTYKSGNVSLI